MLAASKPGRNGSRCIVDRSGRTQSVGSFVVRWWIGWSKASETRPRTTSNSQRISYQRRKTKTSIGLLHHFAFLFFSSSFSLLFPGLVVFCFFFSTFATETERERERKKERDSRLTADLLLSAPFSASRSPSSSLCPVHLFCLSSSSSAHPYLLPVQIVRSLVDLGVFSHCIFSILLYLVLLVYFLVPFLVCLCCCT